MARRSVTGPPTRTLQGVASNGEESCLWARAVAGDERAFAPQELLYLNPLRRRGDSTELYVGEQLNLDPTHRDWFWR